MDDSRGYIFSRAGIKVAFLRTDRENSALTYTVWSETGGQEIYHGENVLPEEWKEFRGINH